MTIKWVKSDPLVMNGEPFCYGTRLTVRNLLEMRANGMTPDQMIGQNPELRAPEEYLPDEDKPHGIADALDRFGIPRSGAPDAGTSAAATTAKPPPEPEDESP